MRLISECRRSCQEDLLIFSDYISESKSRLTAEKSRIYDEKRSGTPVWDNHLLENYRQARFRFVPQEENIGPEENQHGQAPRRLEGWIEEDESALEQARGCGYPECRVGEIPVWDEPWRLDNARKGWRDDSPPA